MGSMVVLLCFGCGDDDGGGPLLGRDGGREGDGGGGGGDGDGSASGSATVSVSGSSECSNMLDASVSTPNIVVASNTDSGHAVAVTASNEENTLQVTAGLEPLQAPGSPPEGSYTLEPGDIAINALQVKCGPDQYVIQTSEGQTAADLSELSNWAFTLNNWNRMSSIEASGDSCGDRIDSNQCRLSSGTMSIDFAVTWTTGSGAEVSFDMDTDGAEATWFEAL
jgi:hypothetical protein